MIDIIIPYCRQDLYPRCLRSIEQQTQTGIYRIVLIDDTFGELGPVKAYNKGMRESPHDVVLMNDDIVVTENWLANMLDVDADVVVSLFHNEPFYANISCTLVRRYVIEKTGYLDENWFLGFGADNDWFIRMNQQGFKIAVNPRNRIFHLHRASIRTVPNFREIAEKEQKRFLEKYGRNRSTDETGIG